jgi:hypothetical protein
MFKDTILNQGVEVNDPVADSSCGPRRLGKNVIREIRRKGLSYFFVSSLVLLTLPVVLYMPKEIFWIPKGEFLVSIG